VALGALFDIDAIALGSVAALVRDAPSRARHGARPVSHVSISRDPVRGGAPTIVVSVGARKGDTVEYDAKGNLLNDP
jgi:hypothetical protein